MTTSSALRRLVAGAAALALGAAGALTVATTASAAPVAGNIDATATGSIIIHKHVKDAASTPGNPAGDPLEGVRFSVAEVLLEGQSVPLATAEGWTAIEDLAVEDVPGGDFTLGTANDAVTNADGVATVGGLKVGLYLVTETGSGNNLITEPAAPFLVTIPFPQEDGKWLYDVDVYPKNVLGSVSEPSKTVGTPTEVAGLTVGAEVPFTISAPVAKLGLDYQSFSISDELSAGLTFDSWGVISIGGTALVAADYTISADNSTVTLTASGLAKLNAAVNAGTGSTVVANINAEVNSLGQLDNTATVTVNGQPADTPEVTTNWAGLEITKVDATSEALLAGATFELYTADKTTMLATGTTDDEGKLSFVVWVGNNDVIAKDVVLKETVAPQGYVLPADPWSEKITLTAGTTADKSVAVTQIGNAKFDGPWLPDTGSTGTLAMTAGGLVLAIAGLVGLAAARRRRTAA